MPRILHREADDPLSDERVLLRGRYEAQPTTEQGLLRRLLRRLRTLFS